METWLWNTLFGLFAIYIGSTGFFNTKGYLDQTYKQRESLDKLTRTRFFTGGYPNNQTRVQQIVTKIISGTFLVVGVLLILGVIHLKGTN